MKHLIIFSNRIVRNRTNEKDQSQSLNSSQNYESTSNETKLKMRNAHLKRWEKIKNNVN